MESNSLSYSSLKCEMLFFSPESVPCDKLGDTGGEKSGEPFDDACGIIKQLTVYTGPCGPVDDVVTGLYVVYWYFEVIVLLMLFYCSYPGMVMFISTEEMVLMEDRGQENMLLIFNMVVLLLKLL